ncbi:hypothetical protein E1A91_D07G156700v1 [Gossypium mustelinum]|uniref:Uncharacterized protein n=1 Tax=Gossypium mustelinum TaxID=34275 RepID=A0A5D2U8C3_GOSMU|nr:hypothetical protein E1A91_D07G156700v1 [Gossypium mustelinum]
MFTGVRLGGCDCPRKLRKVSDSPYSCIQIAESRVPTCRSMESNERVLGLLLSLERKQEGRLNRR